MKTKKAAVLPAAEKIELQRVSYPKTESLSNINLKQEIGTLLLCLQFPVGELRQVGWGLFERMLKRYIALYYTSKGVSGPSESSNVGKRVSG
jgi:hypothetical protein